MSQASIPIAAAFALGACAGQGALDQASLSPNCAPEDLTCATTGLDRPLAVGGSLAIAVDPTISGAVPATRLVSAADDIVTVHAGDTVRGVAPGVAALLVMLHDQDVVLDFLHVTVMVPDHVALHHVTDAGFDLGETTGPLQLLAGDQAVLDVELLAGVAPLAGTANATWSSDSDAVTILSDGVGSHVRLAARKAGTANLAVTTMGMTSSLTVEVLP